tara:strand:- start:723 stop:1574 length:852 start_codon:yes stop_codon:yes gene_type:complete
MFQINWKLKAFLYKVFGVLKLNLSFYFIQKYITKRAKIQIKQINKLWVYHADSIEKNNVKNILEVGAGKSLEQNIYISYRFKGLIKQTAIDINKMIDFSLLNQASEQISKILKLKNKGKVKNLKQLNDLYNIDYVAPCELRNLKNKNIKFGMAISTTALEHFTIIDLKEYLDVLKTILSKGGLISSIIDYSDHYSHTDRNISALNYLSYTEKEWKKYNNSYLFQNRLRHQDYKKIFKTGGYKIEEVFLGEAIQPQAKISDEFDVNDKETFIGWAYFLISKEVI